MKHVSTGLLFCVMMLGLLLGARGVWAAGQLPGPTAVTAPAPKPQKYVCNSETNKCTCSGASDCIDLNGSGQCSDTLAIKGKVATCGWVGPPPKPSTALSRPNRGPLSLATAQSKPLTKYGLGTLQNAPGRPNPMPYECEFKNNKLKGCLCTGISDCLKLDDSGLCGSKEIQDTDDGGVCYGDF